MARVERPNMALQRTPRPRFLKVQFGPRSVRAVQERAGTGRSLRSLGAPLNARPLGAAVALSEVAGMPENKTKPTDASVEDYIASRANEQQRTDCRELMALLEMVTQQSPRMWGPSIVGYGSYRYTYESGRTGEAPLESGLRHPWPRTGGVPGCRRGQTEVPVVQARQAQDGQGLPVLQTTGRSRQVGAQATRHQLGR